MKIVYHYLVACLFLCIPFSPVIGQVRLSSPDAKLRIVFSTTAQTDTTSPLSYTVDFNNKPLLANSAMGLDIKGGALLGANVKIKSSKIGVTDDSYTLTTGKASNIRNHYNSLLLELTETTGSKRTLQVEARAYNDAVAFRYIVPEQQGLDSFEITNENTEFHFSKDATTYSLVLPHYRSMYESEFLKLSVSAFSNQGGVKSSVLIGLPLLAEVPGVGWLAIAESDLKGYSSMYLTNPSGGWSGHTLLSRLAPQIEKPDVAVSTKAGMHSPWRIIMVGNSAGDIVESNAVMNLSPEPAVTDVSWVQPGKASWDWWNGSISADGRSAFTTENMRYYVDFAAKSGFKYMLVDAGWSGNDLTKPNGRVDIPALVDYARQKNVKVWIWAYGKYVENQMDKAFPLFEKWGVAGVKIDFIERDDQHGIQFYYNVAKKAAEHHLMLDFHGCTKPFGLERTYPNVMNYESVLGMEQSKGGTRDNPENHAMLPFTRMLTGPMDYTPGGFNNVTREAFVPRGDKPMVMGTRAHHLALYVVLQGPLQMVSDYPAAYDNQPAFNFIKQVPTAWNETKVIDGVPGEFITIARRSGENWYIGSITDWKSRSLQIPLKFLKPGNYIAEVYADAPNAGTEPKQVVISKIPVTNTSILKPVLASGGGYAVRIVPAGKR